MYKGRRGYSSSSSSQQPPATTLTSKLKGRGHHSHSSRRIWRPLEAALAASLSPSPFAFRRRLSIHCRATTPPPPPPLQNFASPIKYSVTQYLSCNAFPTVKPPQEPAGYELKACMQKLHMGSNSCCQLWQDGATAAWQQAARLQKICMYET